MGFIDVPASGFSLSGGVNLGTKPTSGQYNVIIKSNMNANKANLVEYCYGQGYCFIDMMTYDWWANGTGVGGRQDVLLQNVRYITFIRNNFNS